MLSHRDSDHTGGAQAVLAMQPQVRLWSSLEEEHPLLQKAAHQRCEAGQHWTWDGVRFEVLHPQPGAVSARPNALSCVLRVQGSGGAALLVGDIEQAQERELLAQGLQAVDVLLVPHHGSRTSSSEAFLDALRPGMAWVQAGYRNRFGHPAADVMARYRERGIQVLTSVQCGAATWHSDQPQAVRCEREANRRYWHHGAEP
jgi:competence protein ComEC